MDTNTTRTIPLGRAAVYGTLDVDCSRFNDTVHEYVYSYGLRQILNDAMADKKDDDGKPLADDAIRAKALKRLDNMYAGELRQRRESAEPTDPVEAEAWKLAKAAMTTVYKEIGAWAAVPKGTKDRFAAVIANRRAVRGLDPLPADEAVADAIEKFLAGPSGASVRKMAERNVKDHQAMVKAAADQADLV